MKATPSTWEDCTDPSSPTADRAIAFDPAVPVKGQDNFVYLTGQLLERVTGGSCSLGVTWNGVPVANEAFDACGNSTITLPLNLGVLSIEALDCPQAAGPMDLEIIADLSVLAPPGAYSIKADCTGNDNAPLVCADVAMRL